MAIYLSHKIAAIVAGISLGFGLFNTQPAQAFRIYDFTFTWPDQTKSSGWFQVDDPPTYIETAAAPEDYYYESWKFQDFSFTHLGKTYGLGDVLYGSTYYYNFFDQSRHVSKYGTWMLNWNSFIKDWEAPVAFFSVTQSAPSGQFRDSRYAYSYSTNQYAISVNLEQRRTTPEPYTLLGLVIAGTGLAALRRQE